VKTCWGILAGVAGGVLATLAVQWLWYLGWGPAAEPTVDARDAGLPIGWVIFGFGAQAVFMSRFLVQWLASERERRSVVPTSFWLLSLAGGLTLCVYFLRRGDPVGVAGQATGVLIYLRNLFFIAKQEAAQVGGHVPGVDE